MQVSKLRTFAAPASLFPPLGSIRERERRRERERERRREREREKERERERELY
jgi:hypothetical protein